MDSCYPVFYQYKEYSVNFKHLSKDDLDWLREAVKERCALKYNGVNY
jgi:hypothetical protein